MDDTDSTRDPAFRSATILIALLFALSVAGVVHSLIVTFGG